MTTAHLLFSSTKVPNLLAQSYSSDVTITPAAAARGSANLKINGAYSQTDFRTHDGDLWIKGTDGNFTNAGPARGRFDPAVLLDPQRGVAGLVSLVADARVDEQPVQLDGHDAVKITGSLPVQAAAVLVPASSLGDNEQLPVTLWIGFQKPYTLEQAIVTVGGGSLTLKLSAAEPFTTNAG